MKTQDKTESAYRIMEALSNVDEELLARCEGRPGKISPFVRRRTGAAAAILCLALLGSAFYGVRELGSRTGSTGSADRGTEGSFSAASAVTADTAGAEETADEAEELCAEPSNENAVQTEEDAASLKGRFMTEQEFAGLYADEREKLSWLDSGRMHSKEDAGQELQMQGADESTKSAETEEWAESEESAETDGLVMTWEEALALEAFADHIPDSLPAGYARLYAIYFEEEESLVLAAEDGRENLLWMKLTQTDFSVDIRIDAEPPVYTVEEDWKSLIPAEDEDGRRRFGLLFEDGMLVEYRGSLQEDELEELLGEIG